MKDKILKVYEAPGHTRDIPRINLQGQWLSNLGYHVGDHIKVTFLNNQIIIEPHQDNNSEISNPN